MAIIRDENEKNRPKNTMGGSSFVGGGYQATAPSAATNGGRGGGGSSGGGNFVNIDRYLAGDLLTKGGEAASSMVSDVETEGNKIASGIDEASSLGSGLIKDYTPTFDKGKADEIMGGITGATETITSQPNIPAVTKYTGPTEFTGLPGMSGVVGQVSSLGTKAGALGDLGGVQTAMKGKYQAPVSALDAFGTQVAGGKKLSDTAKKFGGVDNWLTGKLNTATQGFQEGMTGLRAAEQNVADQWTSFGEQAKDQIGKQNAFIAFNKQLAADQAKKAEDEAKAREDWANRQAVTDQPDTQPPPKKSAWEQSRLGKFLDSARRNVFSGSPSIRPSIF